MNIFEQYGIKEIAASRGLNIDVAKAITLNKAAKEESKENKE